MGSLRISVTITVAVLIIVAALTLPALRGQGQRTNKDNERKAVDENDFPLVDYGRYKLPDTVEHAIQKKRAVKHDRSDWAVNPSAPSDTTVRVDSVDPNLAAFPFHQAETVDIGSVLKAEANLSNDKTGVFSTFTISVEEVVKHSSNLVLSPGTLIDGEREGGRVRCPSGRIHLYLVNEQNMPRVGSRYVFFLVDGDGPVFEILTGYELRENKVYPLDNLVQSRKYEGSAEADFLNVLKTSASTSQN